MADNGAGPARHTGSPYPGSTNNPRRLSYASVVTGTPATPLAHTARLASNTQSSTNYQSSSYPPRYYPDVTTMDRDHGLTTRPSSSSQRRGLSFSTNRPTSSSSLPAYWVPRYLEGSRYAKKVRTAYEARLRALRDQNAALLAGPSSFWNRSSNARITPSHRGMTYDVVESNPPVEDDIIPPPTKLSNTDRNQGLDLLGEGLEVRYNGATGKDLEAASVRSDHPISPQCGIYYYEITIRQKSKDCAVAIGFSTSDFSLERLPGWEPKSWAYHGDDGRAFEGQTSGHPYKSGFGANDVIGCGIDFNKNHAFFTKNGQDLGVAFKDIAWPSTPVFPCIGTKKHPGVVISINFGQQPFMFDIIDKMSIEQDIVARDIAKTTTQRLHPDQPIGSIYLQEVIAQYLSHGGYIETARAFTKQVDNERRALRPDEPHNSSDLHNPDTFDARPRQEIRQAILSGDIDAAFNITEEYFPSVLEAHPEILFQLKCRKFIELVLTAASMDKSRDTIRGKSQTNGFGTHHSHVDDVFDSAMEIDVEHQPYTNGHNSNEEYNELTAESIEYGRKLKEEYGEKGKPEYDKILHDVFSLMPYYDPSPSQNGHLLDSSGRAKVAEDLNSAILLSLKRPPAAALETLMCQTEGLLEVLSLNGGAASLVDTARQPSEPYEY